MATLFTVLRKDKINKKGKAPIHFRITKNRKNRYISASLMIEPKYWDVMKERVKPNYPNSRRLNAYLANKYNELQNKLFEYETDSKTLTVPVLKGKIMGAEPTSFFAFADDEQKKYWSAKQFSTHKKNKYILNKLRKYCKNKPINFQEMDVEFIIKYENYLRDVEGNSTNTINKDFRFIRTLFNNAVRLDVIEANHNPFLKYKLKSEKTFRSYLNEEELKAIENLDLPFQSLVDLTRDMFVFASYAGGLRISDLLMLERKKFDGSYLDLSIYKTNGQLSLKLPNKALEIIEKWRECSPRFLFPMLPQHFDLKNKQAVLDTISSKTALVNKNLKKIAKLAEISKRLTTHIARHTWATRALRKGISIDKVSKLMGHAQIRDTQIYAKIVNEELDKAMDVFND